MAGFEYGGGGGEDQTGGSARPFESEGYMGFDSSQRFDESRRFDESFRAPDHFNPGTTFGDEPKEENEDDFKSANGFGYHQAEAPLAYGFEHEPTGQPAEASPGYEPSFEPDLHSEYGQGAGDFTGEHGSNGNGFGTNGDDDTLFSSIPPSDGPILPPPDEMREDGLALREWKRQNALRLQEKERQEREDLARIIKEADDYKESQYDKRKSSIENGKKNNRDREKTYLQNQDTFHKEADKHYWKAVAELIPNELPTIDKGGKKDKKDKKPGIVAIKGPKPGKSTDMTRLRHVLVKLKHNPPPHMKYKPPPPPPVADKDKAKDKDGKEKEAVPKQTEGPPAPAPAPPPPTPVAAA